MRFLRVFACLLCIALASIPFQVNAQVSSAGISYYGLGFIRPGVKVGANYQLKTWTKISKDSLKVKSRSYFVQPQVGVYWKLNSYTGVVLNVEGGFMQHTASKKLYAAYTIGFGYLSHFEVTSFTADFKGNIGNKEYEWRHYVIPSVNAEFGWFPFGNKSKSESKSKGLGIFTKISAGWRLSGEYGSSFTPAGELGIRVRLNTRSSDG